MSEDWALTRCMTVVEDWATKRLGIRMLVRSTKINRWIKDDSNFDVKCSNSHDHVSLNLYVKMNAQWRLLQIQGEWVCDKKLNTRTF